MAHDWTNLQENVIACFREHVELSKENAALRAENERLRKDAERYRWLRTAWDSLDSFHDIWDSDGTPEGFDAAIDAALAKEPT